MCRVPVDLGLMKLPVARERNLAFGIVLIKHTTATRLTRNIVEVRRSPSGPEWF